METKLKIAIQKSGRLNEDSLRLIKDCGIAVDKGTNPLQVTARRDGGLSLKSFIKKITFQKISRQARMNPGPGIETMAAAEHLSAHPQAVRIHSPQLHSKS